MLMDLVDTSYDQSGLYEKQRSPKEDQLMCALDQINGLMGAGTLRYAASGAQKKSAASLHCSPSYTTSWDALLQVT